MDHHNRKTLPHPRSESLTADQTAPTAQCPSTYLSHPLPPDKSLAAKLHNEEAIYLTNQNARELAWERARNAALSTIVCGAYKSEVDAQQGFFETTTFDFGDTLCAAYAEMFEHAVTAACEVIEHVAWVFHTDGTPAGLNHVRRMLHPVTATLAESLTSARCLDIVSHYATHYLPGPGATWVGSLLVDRQPGMCRLPMWHMPGHGIVVDLVHGTGEFEPDLDAEAEDRVNDALDAGRRYWPRTFAGVRYIPVDVIFYDDGDVRPRARCYLPDGTRVEAGYFA